MTKPLLFILIMFLGSIFFAFSFKEQSRTYLRGELFLPETKRTKEAKILFVGDMNFDRHIRQMMERKGENFIFSCIGDFLKDADAVVGNLEGPITENASVSMGSKPETPENYVFTFSPSIAELLAKNNIKIINLGNNHIRNFEEEGIISTKNYLDKAGVRYFIGDEILRTEIKEIKMSFVSFNEFGESTIQEVSENIKKEKRDDRLVIVYAHWGDEYVEVPERVKKMAKILAESGADLIIGSHPHIIQKSEKIKNMSVYYSLGNFIFDQYWSKEVSSGLVLEVDIKKFNGRSQIIIVEHQVSMSRDGRTCLVN